VGANPIVLSLPLLKHAALSRGPYVTFLIGWICIASRWLKLLDTTNTLPHYGFLTLLKYKA
jgi:hypothetical protein